MEPKLVKAGPWAAGITGTIVGAAVTPVAAAPVLGLVGYGPEGPVKGGLAAKIQAGIGSVAPGSSFAVAQGIALGAPVPYYGIAIGGLILGTLSLLAYLFVRIF